MTLARQLKRDRASDLSRDRIVDAAARAFAQSGYKAATMRAIAEEVGCRASSLYTYFSSKDEILAALVEKLMSDVFHNFDEPMPAGLSFTQRLELLLLRQMKLVEERRDAYLFLMSMRQSGEGMPAEVTTSPDASEAYIERLTDWLLTNTEPADLGGRPARSVAYLLYGAQFGLFRMWLRDGPEVRLTCSVRCMMELFIGGLAASPQ